MGLMRLFFAGLLVAVGAFFGLLLAGLLAGGLLLQSVGRRWRRAPGGDGAGPPRLREMRRVVPLEPTRGEERDALPVRALPATKRVEAD